MSLLKIIAKVFEPPPAPKPPAPKPPPPAPQPAEDLNAKIADQRQQAHQLRARLERLENNVPTLLRPAVEFAGQILESNPSPELVRLIAQKNAPILVLPPGSSAMPNVNLPADPQEFVAHSRLRENVPAGVDVRFAFPPVSVSGEDRQIGDNFNGDPNDNFSSADVGDVTNENLFLDLDDRQQGQLGSTDAPIYYQFEPARDGEPPKLTYHIFYAYNDAPTGGLTSDTKVVDLNHEGDWERVTYELDPTTFNPTNIIPSAHTGSSEPTPFPESGRPMIYVANGSHANYVTPGNKPLQFNAADQTAVDRNGDGAVNEADGAVIFDTARNLQEVTAQPWYPSTGSRGLHWGEIGTLENVGNPFGLSSSGPQGPSYDKGAVE